MCNRVRGVSKQILRQSKPMTNQIKYHTDYPNQSTPPAINTVPAKLGNPAPGRINVKVWADAVCIDQSNFKERAEQVTLMGKIYSRAASVVIYTGPALGIDDDFCRFVERLERWGLHRMQTGDPVTSEMQYRDRWHEFGLPDRNDPHWEKP